MWHFWHKIHLVHDIIIAYCSSISQMITLVMNTLKIHLGFQQDWVSTLSKTLCKFHWSIRSFRLSLCPQNQLSVSSSSSSWGAKRTATIQNLSSPDRQTTKIYCFQVGSIIGCSSSVHYDLTWRQENVQFEPSKDQPKQRRTDSWSGGSFTCGSLLRCSWARHLTPKRSGYCAHHCVINWFMCVYKL